MIAAGIPFAFGQVLLDQQNNTTAVGTLLTQPTMVPEWQKAAGGKMEFEVASIRLSAPGTALRSNVPISAQANFTPTGGIFTADATLDRYIDFAYKLFMTSEQKEALLAPLPKWVSTQRFTIQARAAGDPIKDQYRLMMQTLLADRFKMVAHFERRLVPVLALTLIKPGKLGPYLRAHANGPPCNIPASPTGSTASIAPGTPVDGSLEFPFWCDGETARLMPNNLVEWGIRNSTIAYLAADLPNLPPKISSRPVVDQTGLIGKFDFALVWEWIPPSNGATPSVTDAQPDLRGLTLEEAVEKQLGLKLKPTVATLGILIVDHVELPSEN